MTVTASISERRLWHDACLGERSEHAQKHEHVLRAQITVVDPEPGTPIAHGRECVGRPPCAGADLQPRHATHVACGHQRNAGSASLGQVVARHVDPDGQLDHDFLDGEDGQSAAERLYWLGAARTYFAVVLFGLGYTVYSEWINVEVRHTWAYSNPMPRVPPLGTGLSPCCSGLLFPFSRSWSCAVGPEPIELRTVRGLRQDQATRLPLLLPLRLIGHQQ